MNETQSKLWFSGVAYIPYVVLAYGFNWLTNGSNSDLGTTLAVLLGGRLLYALIDGITAEIAWRVDGKKRAIEAFLKLMRETDMPKRDNAKDSLADYLNYLDSDYEKDPVIRSAARQISTIIEQSHYEGLRGGIRIENAAQLAYERYQDELPAFLLPGWVGPE